MTTGKKANQDRPPIPDSEIIERFGGIRPMASKLGVAVTTVQGWKERNHIPEARYSQIVKAAAEHGIDLGQSQGEAAGSVSARDEKRESPEPVETPTKADSRAEEAKTGPDAPPEVSAARVGEPASAHHEAPPSGGGRGGVPWSALIVAFLLLAVAIATAPLWTPRLYPELAGGQAGNGQLDEINAGLARVESATQELARDLKAQQGQLSDRIDALEAGGGETGAAFASQLSQIEQAVGNLSGKLDTVDSGLGDIDSRIAQLEAKQDDVPQSVETALAELKAATDELRNTVGEVRESVGDLSERLAASGENVTGIEERVSELESRPVQTGEKIAAMVLALGQVESALDTGRPYEAALNRLALLAKDDPLIAEGQAVVALAPWAESGIPDRLELRRRFDDLAPDIQRAISDTEDGTWLDSVWDRVKGLITIRRIDGSNLSPVARAERALDDGNLVAAAAAFDGQGSLGPEGDAWLELVRARIRVEKEIDELYAEMIEPLAGEGGASPGNGGAPQGDGNGASATGPGNSGAAPGNGNDGVVGPRPPGDGEGMTGNGVGEGATIQ